MDYVVLLIASYVVGSIPCGLILGKLIWNTDLRQYGSGNIGATNAWRTIGKQAGIVIFVCDLLKGVIGVSLGHYLVGTDMAAIIGGLMTIVGHSASIFMGFKGGKGVATGLGVLLMLMPIISIIVFALWLIIVLFTGLVSLASVIAAICVPVLIWIFDLSLVYGIFGVLAALCVVYRHKSNIQRLLNGTESKITAKRR